MFITYLRDEVRRPYGVYVVLPDGSTGMSLCNPKDNFLKDRGRTIAIARALQDESPEIGGPDAVAYVTTKAAAHGNGRGRIPAQIVRRVIDEIATADERAARFYRGRKPKSEG